MVSTAEHCVCVKVLGRANFTLAVDFKALLGVLGHGNYPRLVLDLGECLLMDSTFLGVLAGFGLKSSQVVSNHGPAVSIELLNPNQRVRDLLENVGILELFKVFEGAFTASGTVTGYSNPATPSRLETTRTCLEAHKTLMTINPDNAAKFKDVAQFLADDLRKQSQQS